MVYSALTSILHPKRGSFGLLGSINILALYPLSYYPGINIIEGWNNGHEKLRLRLHWNDGDKVIFNCNPIKYFGIYCTGLVTLVGFLWWWALTNFWYMELYIELCRITSKQYVKW